jgi:hypothetical protein
MRTVNIEKRCLAFLPLFFLAYFVLFFFFAFIRTIGVNSNRLEKREFNRNCLIDIGSAILDEIPVENREEWGRCIDSFPELAASFEHGESAKIESGDSRNEVAVAEIVPLSILF